MASVTRSILSTVHLALAMRAGTALVLISSMVVAVAPPAAHAQDSHYWSQQYGTRSELLGGAEQRSFEEAMRRVLPVAEAHLKNFPPEPPLS